MSVEFSRLTGCIQSIHVDYSCVWGDKSSRRDEKVRMEQFGEAFKIMGGRAESISFGWLDPDVVLEHCPNVRSLDFLYNCKDVNPLTVCRVGISFKAMLKLAKTNFSSTN